MTCLLYRDQLGEQREIEAAREVWGEDFYQYRSQIPPESAVIARYSVWPFYEEVENELALRDASLVHDTYVHDQIADMKWYHTIPDMTPDTWFNEGYVSVPYREQGWVVKGRTNSRKWQWSEMMYAEDRDELEDVMSRLRYDGQISDQGLAIREYVPLEKVGEGINDLPMGNEWRFFFLGDQLVVSGFYWAIAERAPEMTETPRGATEVAKEAAEKIHLTWGEDAFFVLDVAKTKEGDWIVIEVNDGQMSGLSTIDPVDFYSKIRELDV